MSPSFRRAIATAFLALAIPADAQLVSLDTAGPNGRARYAEPAGSDRAFQSKAGNSVNATDLGARCDGAHDDTTALQAALNALAPGGNSILTLPGGNCRISQPLTFVYDTGTLVGQGIRGTIIESTNLTQPVLVVRKSNIRVTSIGLRYVGTPMSGATAIYNSGANNEFDHFYIDNARIGFEDTGNHGAFVHDFQIWNYADRGLYIHDAGDIYVHDFILNADKAAGRMGGIRLQDNVQAASFMNGGVLGGEACITMDAGFDRDGSRPQYNKFTNVYFDSSRGTCGSFDHATDTDFLNVWFSGGRTGNGFSGVVLGDVDGFRFTNSTFFNNGAHGAFVSAAAAHTTFVNCTFSNNGVSDGSRASSGLYIARGAHDFSVVASRLGNSPHPATQAYGIYLEGVASRFSLLGNLTDGNRLAGVFETKN